MTALIKARTPEARHGVRAVTVAPPPSRRDEEMDGLHALVARLRDEDAAMRADILALQASAATCFGKGFEAGHAAGLSAAEDRADERTRHLVQAIAGMRADLDRRLASMERLAALLARDCLDRMFADAEDRAGIVCDLIARQMAQIDATTLLRIEICAQDFDDQAVAGLTRLARNVRVEANDTRLPGSCEMIFELGRMSIGLDQQWGTLKATLSELDGADHDGRPDDAS